MITAIVSAIGGPISLVISGWLGGSGMWWKWPWNLVPTPVGMPGNGVSLGAAGHAMNGVFRHYSFFIVREWFAEQGPGDKTWACSLCGFRLGFWVERDWGHGPRCWVRVQGPNGSGYLGAVLLFYSLKP